LKKFLHVFTVPFKLGIFVKQKTKESI